MAKSYISDDKLRNKYDILANRSSLSYWNSLKDLPYF